MQKGLLLAILLISSFIVFSGCTGPATCGDGICNGNETALTCIDDCEKGLGVAPVLNITVRDANTNAPIPGATVTISEAALDLEYCAVDISNNSQERIQANSDGFATITLETQKKYAAFAEADEYNASEEYQCVILNSNELLSIDLLLNKS